MKALLILFSVAALCLPSLAGDKSRVSVEVSALKDPTGHYPDSNLYIASVTNNGRTGVTFQVFQMPGGYVGSGTFFNCSIEQWNTTAHKWVVFKRTQTAEYPSSTVREVTLKAGQSREACQAMLPQEGQRKVHVYDSL